MCSVGEGTKEARTQRERTAGEGTQREHTEGIRPEGADTEGTSTEEERTQRVRTAGEGTKEARAETAHAGGIRSNIKQLRRMLSTNKKTLILFELLFKLLSLLIFTPLFLNLFNLTMRLAGYRYITLENVIPFLLKPVTLVMLVLLLLAMMAYTMFDITAILITLDQSYHGRKLTVTGAVRMSARKCVQLLHLRNLPLVFLTLFLIPFLNLGMATGFVTSVKIPEFILDFIVQNNFLLFLLIALAVFLSCVLLRWFYSLHYFVLEGLSFKEARKKSAALGRGKHLGDLLTMAAVQIVISLAYMVYILAGILIIFAVRALLGRFILVSSFVSTIVWLFIALSFVVFTVLSTPISYTGISVLYYAHKEEMHERIIPVEVPESDRAGKENRWLRAGLALLTVAAVAVGTMFSYGLANGKYNLAVEYVRTTEVTAHRGASVAYPENTMAAFVGAKELGADWIELDVQQTADGQIIVLHDSNLRRTTGLDRNTWEVTWDEVRQLDAGSFFDPAFAGEPVPLLSDVITFAKENGMKLNIELKPSGHETDFEKSVTDLIREQDFAGQCVLTSQIYSVLENVKSCAPEIQTVYVLSLAYGDITSLTAADHFSVEASSVNQRLVRRVHGEGKQLYAWTVNTEDSIRSMMNLNVDNIITDNITMAKEIIFAGKTSNLISEYIRLVEGIF